MFSDVSAALKLAQWEANFGSLGRWGLEEGILYSRGHNSSRIWSISMVQSAGESLDPRLTFKIMRGSVTVKWRASGPLWRNLVEGRIMHEGRLLVAGWNWQFSLAHISDNLARFRSQGMPKTCHRGPEALELIETFFESLGTLESTQISKMSF